MLEDKAFYDGCAQALDEAQTNGTFDLLEASSISYCSDSSSRAVSIVTTHHRQTLETAIRDLVDAYELCQSEGGPEDEGREREGKGMYTPTMVLEVDGVEVEGGWAHPPSLSSTT